MFFKTWYSVCSIGYVVMAKKTVTSLQLKKYLFSFIPDHLK